MFGYYLDLALRSLKRNPVLTGLMITAIGFGIGTSMTSFCVSRARHSSGASTSGVGDPRFPNQLMTHATLSQSEVSDPNALTGARYP